MPSLLPIADELEVLIRARYPLLYIVSWEDERVLASTESNAQGAYALSVMLSEQKCEVRCVVDSTPSVQTEPKWLDQRTAVADFRLS